MKLGYFIGWLSSLWPDFALPLVVAPRRVRGAAGQVMRGRSG